MQEQTLSLEVGALRRFFSYNGLVICGYVLKPINDVIELMQVSPAYTNDKFRQTVSLLNTAWYTGEEFMGYPILKIPVNELASYACLRHKTRKERSALDAVYAQYITYSEQKAKNALYVDKEQYVQQIDKLFQRFEKQLPFIYKGAEICDDVLYIMLYEEETFVEKALCDDDKHCILLKDKNYSALIKLGVTEYEADIDSPFVCYSTRTNVDPLLQPLIQKSHLYNFIKDYSAMQQKLGTHKDVLGVANYGLCWRMYGNNEDISYNDWNDLCCIENFDSDTCNGYEYVEANEIKCREQYSAYTDAFCVIELNIQDVDAAMKHLINILLLTMNRFRNLNVLRGKK